MINLRLTRICPVFLILVILHLPEKGIPSSPPGKDERRGITGAFGAPPVAGLSAEKRAALLKELRGVNAVFVPPDRETIRFFKVRGFKVFLTANVFGGKDAWRLFPDARPILADGRFLDAETEGDYGGVCPTHKEWRSARLGEIGDWIKRFSGKDGIDGVWLDFIRYPGGWEKGLIPDACYCPRCLAKFRRDTGLTPPESPAEAAAWLGKYRPYEWMAWKKEQIASFVREVREIVKRGKETKASGGQAGRLLTLGAFVVPWTKGEQNGAVTFLLGQDAFALSGIVDVISPMVYHRMVGRPAAWVGEMTAYYRETARCEVWPIIQAAETTLEEFGEAVRQAVLGDANGLLAFSYRDMGEEKRKALAGFKPPENLIPDPDFGTADKRGAAPRPSWSTNSEGAGTAYGPRYEVKSSGEFKGAGDANRLEAFPCLGSQGGTSVPGQWSVPLPACEAGQTYRFTCLFHRDTWNELSRTTVSIWGEKFLLEQHLQETFQPLRVTLRCPQGTADRSFSFTNAGSRDIFYLGKPRLIKGLPSPAPAAAPTDGFFYRGFFPIGIYDADIGNLQEIRKLALNTVIIGGEGERLREAIKACRTEGLRYVVTTPRDPERLKIYLERLLEMPGIAGDEQIAFYVDDEPEMRAVPTGRSGDVYRLLKERFPRASTGMAIVRPAYCREYLGASDFFMLDKYPFPNMPMSWLADAMDQAAEDAGRDRLLSVIQAFSDGDHWPSPPGWQQMDSLAFLSIVHGSRGIFFYTWAKIGKTPEGRANLGRVVGRLNRIYPWLLEKNLDRQVSVEMLSKYRVDPQGRPAVHACLKEKGNETMLIAVNSIGAPVEAGLTWTQDALASASAAGTGTEEAREIFSDAPYPVKNGAIRVTLQAYETKAFIIGGGR